MAFAPGVSAIHPNGEKKRRAEAEGAQLYAESAGQSALQRALALQFA